MHDRSTMRACVVVGTRPEAIKLAPVILRLLVTPGVTCTVVNTGQHREMCVQALEAFGIEPDIDLDVMVPGQSLGRLTGKLFAQFDALLEQHDFDWVVVQGDTTSAMVGAMAAFYRHIRVAHVEAGLRTYDRWSPFPEEINRTIIGHIGHQHFPPTQRAAENLVRAGVHRDNIHVTGNTVIDAVTILKPGLATRLLDGVLPTAAVSQMANGRLVVVTSHRRESFGTGIENICRALMDLVERYGNLVVVYPVHLNPNVRKPVMRLLGGQARIHLLDPLPYLDLMALVARCTLILTDSGGLQEEAPSFGKPVLILREVTERPEVLEVGAARLVGTEHGTIVRNASELLDDENAYARMSGAGNPFGDGHASERIVEVLKRGRVCA